MNEISVNHININKFNPFGATEEELIAAALEEAGLINETTLVNNTNAKELLKIYHQKKENFNHSIRIGNLLLQNDVISKEQLNEALAFQNKNSNKKLGEILEEFGYCTKQDIENTLQTQIKIKENIQQQEQTKSIIRTLRERLNEYLEKRKESTKV